MEWNDLQETPQGEKHPTYATVKRVSAALKSLSARLSALEQREPLPESSAATDGTAEKPLRLPFVNLDLRPTLSVLTVQTGDSFKSISCTWDELEALQTFFSFPIPTHESLMKSGPIRDGDRGPAAPDAGGHFHRIADGSLHEGWADVCPICHPDAGGTEGTPIRQVRMDCYRCHGQGMITDGVGKRSLCPACLAAPTEEPAMQLHDFNPPDLTNRPESASTFDTPPMSKVSPTEGTGGRWRWRYSHRGRYFLEGRRIIGGFTTTQETMELLVAELNQLEAQSPRQCEHVFGSKYVGRSQWSVQCAKCPAIKVAGVVYLPEPRQEEAK